MSVALVAQGGAVLGYMFLHRNNNKTKEICISAFTSVLFGISEPALFGVNIKYKYPLIAGCIAGAISGVPGFTIVEPANNGHLNFIIAHLIAVLAGIGLTIMIGKVYEKKTKNS